MGHLQCILFSTHVPVKGSNTDNPHVQVTRNLGGYDPEHHEAEERDSQARANAENMGDGLC